MPLSFDPIAQAGRNWTDRGWAATDAMVAATSLTRAAQIAHTRIDRALAPVGLNFSRFEVLALLSFTRDGRLPMGKIGDRLQVHAASVTNTIQRLETNGLVDRVAHPDDGRAILARLLPPGRAAAEQGARVLAEIDYGLTEMSDRDRQVLGAVLADYRGSAGDWQ